jgi:microcompartment protein CcmK/EutM
MRKPNADAHAHFVTNRREKLFGSLFAAHARFTGGDMEKTIPAKKALIDQFRTAEGEHRTESSVIAKLIGARWEMEDVLLSPNGSAILSAQERSRLSTLMGAIDNIVRRIEKR